MTLPVDDASHRKFDNLFNPMWLCVITLTTVGYGDVYALSVPGKIVSALLAICGAFNLSGHDGNDERQDEGTADSD